ncbi:hypothetical protein [Streptomyces sp. NPDC012888]|uniref:hypothetical protein n=1 Tax=Streptomyces sp. NPDC012888 TaxID=3364855 RepID=UPI0036A7257B
MASVAGVEVVAVRRGGVVVRSAAVAAGVLLAVGAGAGAAGTAAAAGPGTGAGPEADVAYHGRVSLTQGRLGVLLVPANDGPAALPNATVRLRLSAELADEQSLPEGCARAGAGQVVCETGRLPEHGQGRHIGMWLRLKERPSEVTLRIDTLWNGGATDRNISNNEHVVLALDTGDAYAF